MRRLKAAVKLVIALHAMIKASTTGSLLFSLMLRCKPVQFTTQHRVGFGPDGERRNGGENRWGKSRRWNLHCLVSHDVEM